MRAVTRLFHFELLHQKRSFIRSYTVMLKLRFGRYPCNSGIFNFATSISIGKIYKGYQNKSRVIDSKLDNEINNGMYYLKRNGVCYGITTYVLLRDPERSSSMHFDLETSRSFTMKLSHIPHSRNVLLGTSTSN
jgi:hypothetical protein